MEALRAVAEEEGATVAQVAVAWVLARGADIVPLVGARSRDRLSEALGALDLNLSADCLARPMGLLGSKVIRFHTRGLLLGIAESAA